MGCEEKKLEISCVSRLIRYGKEAKSTNLTLEFLLFLEPFVVSGLGRTPARPTNALAAFHSIVWSQVILSFHKLYTW